MQANISRYLALLMQKAGLSSLFAAVAVAVAD